MSAPIDRYRAELARADFLPDPAQQRAIEQLQALYERLLSAPKPRWPARLFGRNRTRVPVRGLYLHGGVGRGKTHLMDMFFASLPSGNKLRLHFHRFMRRMHADLKRCRGAKNPLDKVAARLAAQARVLCFDEFFVSDIADAMILANTLQALFARGVTLVATSNIPPAELYRDGLQRARFLPAIDLLQTHTQTIDLGQGTDYRLRALEQVEIYHHPWDAAARRAMAANFRRLVGDGQVLCGRSLRIAERRIPLRAQAEGVAWFDFDALCGGPRNQNDYIEIAHEFHSVLVGGVPAFDRQDDLARRFIHLIDEFYDRNVNLILGAAVPLEDLYVAGRLQFEFARARSRLLEMRSADYLTRPHRP